MSNHWSDTFNPHLNANPEEESLLHEIEDVKSEIKDLEDAGFDESHEAILNLKEELKQLNLKLKNYQ